MDRNVSYVTNQDYILWQLNERVYRERFLPASIYIGCMILLGGTGNGLVMCVYKSGKQPSTANIFIFFLSVIDFLLCVLAMPFKLFDVRFPMLYGFEWPCKLYEFVEISLSMIAVSMMICIAVDRYLIVSKPLKRFDRRKVKLIVLICFVVGTLCSTPTLIVYGQSKVRTKVNGLEGTTCGVAEQMKSSVVTRVWYMYMYVVFVLTLIVLVVLYIRVWRLINVWKNTVIGESMSRTYKLKAVFKRKSSHVDKPLIPYGGNKNVELRSFYNPYSLENELHELETHNFDQFSDDSSAESNPDKKKSYDDEGSFKIDGNKKLVGCLKKSPESDSRIPTSPTRKVRLSECSDNCGSADGKVERNRISSSGSVFSHGSKRSLLNSRYIPFLPKHRRRVSSNGSVFSSCKPTIRRSSCMTSTSSKRKESFLSGNSGTSFGKRARMRRNTLVFGTISLVFVLSYLPCLVVVGMRTLHIYKVMSSPSINSQIAEIFIRSGYLNNVLNPYIYSFLCPTFRRGVKRLFTK